MRRGRPGQPEEPDRFCYAFGMAKNSAGLLMYRIRNQKPEVLLVHPGGPFWVRKDAGAWSIPKGEIEPGEDPLAAARREFLEELGLEPQGEFVRLCPVTQKAGKTVQAWAIEGDCDPATLRSNTFSLEWPPRSGKLREFPEVDRAAFFEVREAKKKINPAQAELLEELERRLRR